jgi:hypothetical protein
MATVSGGKPSPARPADTSPPTGGKPVPRPGPACTGHRSWRWAYCAGTPPRRPGFRCPALPRRSPPSRSASYPGAALAGPSPDPTPRSDRPVSTPRPPEAQVVREPQRTATSGVVSACPASAPPGPSGTELGAALQPLRHVGALVVGLFLRRLRRRPPRGHQAQLPRTASAASIRSGPSAVRPPGNGAPRPPPPAAAPYIKAPRRRRPFPAGASPPRRRA